MRGSSVPVITTLHPPATSTAPAADLPTQVQRVPIVRYQFRWQVIKKLLADFCDTLYPPPGSNTATALTMQVGSESRRLHGRSLRTLRADGPAERGRARGPSVQTHGREVVLLAVAPALLQQRVHILVLPHRVQQVRRVPHHPRRVLHVQCVVRVLLLLFVIKGGTCCAPCGRHMCMSLSTPFSSTNLRVNCELARRISYSTPSTPHSVRSLTLVDRAASACGNFDARSAIAYWPAAGAC